MTKERLMIIAKIGSIGTFPTDKGTWEVRVNVDKHDGTFKIIPEAHD